MNDERLAILLNDIVTSPPWCKRRVAKAGEAVMASPATNLPADSKIKWWIRPAHLKGPVKHKVEWSIDAGEDSYGVGTYEGDLRLME